MTGEWHGLTAVEGEREAFDPSTVPAYPLVRVAVRETDEGELEGVVDDVVVASDVDLEPVRRAVLAAAAKIAAKRMGPVRAIRVRGTGPDGSVFDLVVTSDSEVFEVPSPSGDAQQAKGRGRRSAPASPGSPKTRRGSFLFVAVLLLPLVLVGAPLAVLATSTLRGEEKAAPPKPPEPTQLPVVAPVPYDPVARWSVPLGTATFASQGSTAAVDDERVYVARDVGQDVAAYDAVTGIREWNYSDLDGAVTTGPTLTMVEDREVLAVASSTQLALLDPTTGDAVGEWDLPSAGQGVTITATGPVVREDAAHARVVVGDDLARRVLPATGRPVAPGPAGTLTVWGGTGQVWVVDNDTLAGDPTTLPPMRGAEPTGVAGWTGERLIVAYQSTRQTTQGSVKLVSFDVDSWARQWATGWLPASVYVSSETEFTLRAAPSGEWGIFGSTAVDLTDGSTKALVDDWQTTSISDVHAFGTGAGRPLMATLAGVTGDSLASTPLSTSSVLVAPQATVGDRAFLIATAGSAGEVLFALGNGETS